MRSVSSSSGCFLLLLLLLCGGDAFQRLPDCDVLTKCDPAGRYPDTTPTLCPDDPLAECMVGMRGMRCCMQCRENKDCKDPRRSRCDIDSGKCVPCREPLDCLHVVEVAGDESSARNLPVCSQNECHACKAGQMPCPSVETTVWDNDGNPQIQTLRYECKTVQPVEGTNQGEDYLTTCIAPNGALCLNVTTNPKDDFVPCLSGTGDITQLIGYDAENIRSAAWCRYDYDHELDRKKCLAGNCISDRDCMHETNLDKPVNQRYKCNMHLLTCVECLDDMHCVGNGLGRGRFCDFEDFRCKTCRDNYDCLYATESLCLNSDCQVCSFSQDCRHIVGRPNCATLKYSDPRMSEGCVAPYSPGEECYSLWDVCTDGKVCRESTLGPLLICQDCRSDEECRITNPDKPLCMQATGSCSQCDPDRITLPGACLGHQMTAYANAGLQPCTLDGYCESCKDDDSLCIADYICDSDTGRCKECTPTELQNCEAGGNHDVCKVGECVDCMKLYDCRWDATTSRCEEGANTCRPCLSHDHCMLFQNSSQCTPTGCVPCTVSSECTRVEVDGEKLAVCNVSNPDAALNSPAAAAFAGNRCVKCTSRTILSENLAQYMGVHYVQNLTVMHNEGCEPAGMVCKLGQCRRCDPETSPCSDPGRSRCDEQQSTCQPCLRNEHCEHIVGQQPVEAAGSWVAREMPFPVCKIDRANGNNECVACVSNKDCPNMLACVDNFCKECTVNQDGTDTCDEGYVCVGTFSSDDDDAVGAAAVAAENTLGEVLQCRATFMHECDENTMCVEGMICEPSAQLDIDVETNTQRSISVCKRRPYDVCETDDNCALDWYCRNGHCHECYKTAHCATDAKGYGACDMSFACTACSSDVQCSNNEQQYLCDEGICGICNVRDTSACQDPAMSKCFRGACSQCRTDDDCSGGLNSMCRLTQPGTMRCVQCTPDDSSRCGFNVPCVNFMCEDTNVDLEESKRVQCDNDRQCLSPDKRYCNKFNDMAKCSECSKDEHCKRLKIETIEWAGVATEFLPDMWACGPMGECKMCTDTSHCRQIVSDQAPAWRVCSEFQCRECNEENVDLCPEEAPHCARGLCRQCDDTTHCPHNLACVNNECVRCVSTEDCGTAHVCHNQRCVECADVQVSQCFFHDKGRFCHQEKCVQCLRTDQCQDGKACLDFKCVECVHDNDCNSVLGDEYYCRQGKKNKCEGQNSETEKRRKQIALALEDPETMKNKTLGNEFCPRAFYQCESKKSPVPSLAAESELSVEEKMAQNCLPLMLLCDGINHCPEADDEDKELCKNVVRKTAEESRGEGSAAAELGAVKLLVAVAVAATVADYLN